MDELKIDVTEENGAATLCLEGRLTTTSAPYLEKMLGSVQNRCVKVVMDCEKLEYVSSAGIRVFKKTLMWSRAQNRELVLRNVGEVVMDVLKMTGMSRGMTIE